MNWPSTLNQLVSIWFVESSGATVREIESTRETDDWFDITKADRPSEVRVRSVMSDGTVPPGQSSTEHSRGIRSFLSS